MTQERKSLSDILNGGSSWIDGNWGDIPAAPEFGVIPRGTYIAHLKEMKLHQAKTGTPGVKLTFEIVEGEYKGRRCWYDIWLTEDAKSQAVRDMRKLNIRDKAQLEKVAAQPVPRWIRCKVTVTVRTSDQGLEENRTKTFEVLGIDKPQADPFAPVPEGGAK